MKFKSQTLPNSCPPSHATPEDLNVVYRFTDTDNISETDFLNHIESGKYNQRKHDECEANALSFFDSIEVMHDLQAKHPFFRRKHIACGKITKECGIHTKKRSHINLWLFENVDIKKIFLGEDEKS